ncbi:hypothetical protein GCHA_3203 [Paraglaciecola chathamensis S18K6]|uniref:Uncharacterized protein n=1 Tax=Paraglaciecola chathamensis S18K6 TaxID=1127672 RepID=A0AAV3V345_9ALTE|nr:hypothetical protein GCHA_3203 [Paraglaciecola chathamensis S18K6]
MRVAYLWPSATEHSFAVYTLRVLSNRVAHHALRLPQSIAFLIRYPCRTSNSFFNS